MGIPLTLYQELWIYQQNISGQRAVHGAVDQNYKLTLAVQSSQRELLPGDLREQVLLS